MNLIGPVMRDASAISRAEKLAALAFQHWPGAVRSGCSISSEAAECAKEGKEGMEGMMCKIGSE